MPVLERTTLVRQPLPAVFDFFSRAENLAKITPPELSFSIVTPLPIAMLDGTVIDYKLSLFGVPFRWRTLIERFEHNVMFVDRQLRGPYKLWRHTHSFVAVPEGTQMTDRVEYEVGFWLLGKLARKAFVDRQVRKIFDYRESVINSLLPPQS